MLSPRWRKVLRELWGNKMRTVLVILSIAVGVFAVGMIVGTQIMLSDDLYTSYAATNPANAELYPGPFDEELVQVVRRMDGIREAEGRRDVDLRLKTGPDEWCTLDLEAIYDYENIQIYKLTPVSVAWPPPKRELLIERSSLSMANADVGDTVVVEEVEGEIAHVSRAPDELQEP